VVGYCCWRVFSVTPFRPSIVCPAPE
jgi:hypothetical protein